MRLRQQMLTRSDCYREGRTIRPLGVMIHSTGANNPRVSRYVPGNDEMGINSAGTHWIASNHADVMHWFPIHGKSMDTFRADVARSMEGTEKMTQEQFDAMMDNYLTRLAKEPASQWAQEGLEQAKAKGITDGTRPRGFATREEVALMVNEAVE